jgi:hypothetical protein
MSEVGLNTALELDVIPPYYKNGADAGKDGFLSGRHYDYPSKNGCHSKGYEGKTDGKAGSQD